VFIPSSEGEGLACQEKIEGSTVFFAKNLTVKDAKEGGGEPEDKTVRMLRHYPVFHAGQDRGNSAI